MTERKRRVEDVLESMGRMVVPVADEPDEQRARVVAALDLRLDGTRAAQRSRRRTHWLIAVAACLSVGAALGLSRPWRAPAPSAQAEPSDLVRRGDTVSTNAHEQRSGHLENGAALNIAPSTELTVSAVAVGGDELILDRGRIELKVPKLTAGRTLSITTPDATVTVRGTRFSVDVRLQDSHPTTHVEVSEGSVWVRTPSERLVLEAGSQWTSVPSPAASAHPDIVAADPAPVTPAAPEPAPSARSASAVASVAAREKSASGVSATPSESSTLAEENALYARAVHALRDGQTSAGLTSLDELLARYPRSPLAQNAVVERIRALRRSGRNADAIAQARQYLANYPQGFARDEAKAIVVDSLPKNP